jgi:hypothetical protein
MQYKIFRRYSHTNTQKILTYKYSEDTHIQTLRRYTQILRRYSHTNTQKIHTNTQKILTYKYSEDTYKYSEDTHI